MAKMALVIGCVSLAAIMSAAGTASAEPDMHVKEWPGNCNNPRSVIEAVVPVSGTAIMKDMLIQDRQGSDPYQTVLPVRAGEWFSIAREQSLGTRTQIYAYVSVPADEYRPQRTWPLVGFTVDLTHC